MAVYKILKVLADGIFHSGEELGEVMGVSRTAVWKHLQKVGDLGLQLESVKGKGYRIIGGVDLLDESQIVDSLDGATKGLLSELLVFSSIDSTNHYLMTERQGAGEVCLAEQQSQGRGRRGRVWVSPFAKNIYLSLSWTFSGGAQALEGLSLAVGVVAVKALEGLGVEGLSLKWPNDLLYKGRKLGGILLEMTGDVSGDCRVVVGIGLNVDMGDEEAAGIDQAWTSVNQVAGKTVSRNQVSVALIKQLLPLLDSYTDNGFGFYKQSWEALDAFKGQAVKLISASTVERGVAVGVTDTGALKLDVDGAIREFSGGEVSLRADA